MSERTDAIVAAVLAVPGVVGLSSGPDPVAGPAESTADGSVSSYVDATSVHVRVAAGAPVGPTAERVQRAAHGVTGGRVDVVVEDIQ